ncbi:MAG: hypothetical protein JXR51_14530 [Bacteroidales bacterium]|nr:hypothetical protein [Bacteroidales bacterium]MBN2758387.1 hypothetical protein [Bacteroidales bacterium]
MERIFLLIFVSIFLFWSCNSDENEENSNNDNLIVEENQQVVENKTNEDVVEVQEIEELKPVLNPDFKSFLSHFAKTSLPYKKNPTGEEVYEKISLNQQINYLTEAEDLSKADLEEMAEYTDFFFVNNPLQTNNYSAIIYARFEMGSTYYFLCTFDNNGKLISHIDFASYELIGAGPQAGQEFNTKGFIDANSEITVKSEEHELKYKIKDDGKIVKL